MNDKIRILVPKTTWWPGWGKYDRQHAARHDGGGGASNGQQAVSCSASTGRT